MLLMISCTIPVFWMLRAYSGDLVSWYFKHIHSLWSLSEIAKSESVLHSTMVIVLMKLVKWDLHLYQKNSRREVEFL